MDLGGETSVITREEYDDLLKKLKKSESENAKLARALRVSENRNAVFKLNVETQSSLNKAITTEKLKQEMYVRLLLESCPDIIFIIDENNKFLLGTNSVSNIISVNDVSVLQGRTLDSIVERYKPPAFTEKMVASITEIIKGYDGGHVEYKFEIDTGKDKYAVNTLSFHKNTGEFVGVLVIMHAITELVKAKEMAEQASRAKGDFLSRMSHEMRTPMNAVIGMTNIAKGSKDPQRIEYCLDKIEGASKHLLGVINDILDMSKIEANKFELSCQEFDFERMLINVTNIVNFRVEEKKQNLIINLDKNFPPSIIGDELRLTQVITNLLTNAVKFTQEGGTVTLGVNKLLDSGENVTLRIEVADNGIGISTEQQARLFTSFEQADGGIARKYGGTGLGLAISKRIVELMEGRIWLESQLGSGSKFIFTIKVKKGRGEPHGKLLLSREDVRILAVDDSLEVREYFSHIMEIFDLPCDVAASGFEALDKLSSSPKPYNIFFVDWQMPGMNGIELTRKIKEITKDNAIIIMISVAEWSEIESEAIAAGVNRFVSKPLFPSVLVDSINGCLIAAPGDKSFAGAAAGDACNYKGHTFLIAEDVDINREIIMAILEETEVSIDFAENGLEAVTLFEADPGRYSLILMDVQMPEMDGYQATREIRSLNCPEAGAIPILAMTANVFREDIESCIQAGMNDHIGKPVDTGELYKKLALHLPSKV